MISRLHNAWRSSAGAVARVGTILADAIDKEDVLTLLGLILVASGLWSVSRAAALLVPGAILLWMFVPSRPPFIERAPRERRPPA